MILASGVIALALVFAIAAVVVGREARRLDAAPPAANFDIDEATEWVGNHLPFEVSAVLSFDDVRDMLEWTLDFLRTKGISSLPSDSVVAEVRVGPEELQEYLLGRASARGRTYSDADVAAVLDAQLGYFDAIGAIGPEVEPDDPTGPEGPDRP